MGAVSLFSVEGYAGFSPKIGSNRKVDEEDGDG